MCAISKYWKYYPFTLLETMGYEEGLGEKIMFLTFIQRVMSMCVFKDEICKFCCLNLFELEA